MSIICTRCKRDVAKDAVYAEPPCAGFSVSGKYPLNWCTDCLGEVLLYVSEVLMNND